MAFLNETGLEYLWSNIVNRVKGVGDGIYRKTGNIVNRECLEGRGIGVTSEIEPIQEGNGDPSPGNVRPISGWTDAKLTRCGKNLLKNTASSYTTNGITFTVNSNGTITANGTSTARAQIVVGTLRLPAGDYILSAGFTTDTRGAFLSYTKNDSTVFVDLVGYAEKTFTLTEQTVVTYTIDIRESNITANNTVYYPMIRKASETDDTYEPYKGDTFTTDFGQTIYGGTLDWNTGVLTVDWAMMTLGQDSAISTNRAFIQKSNTVQISVACQNAIPATEHIISSAFPSAQFNWNEDIASVAVMSENRIDIAVPKTVLTQYGFDDGSDYTKDVAAFKAWLADMATAGTPIQVCYKLATPQTIQLDPKQITSLEGRNYLYTNIGTVIVDFNRDNYIPPIASTTNIGLVSTGSQRFRGAKYLEYPRITSNNTQWQGYSYYHPNGTTMIADHWYDQGDATNVTTGKFNWRQYSPNSTPSETTTGKYENYSLPVVDSGRTSNASYDILTTKNLVQVSQGGTGNSTSLEAANMFLNALEVGTSTPQDADYYISQYASGGTSINTYHRRPVSALYQYIKNKAGSDKFNTPGTSGWAEKLKGISETRPYKYDENSCIYYNDSKHNTGTAQVGGDGDSPTPNSDMWWHFLRFTHNNADKYYTELAIPFNDNSIYYKRVNRGVVINSTNNAGWIKVLDELNYSSVLDGRYINTSGDTMTGALNFKNNTWNNVGDDVAIGDGNIEGKLCIKGLNGNTGIYFAPYSGSIGQTLQVTGDGRMVVDNKFYCLNSSIESSIHAQSDAGDIYLYSQGSSTGHRGIHTISPTGTYADVISISPDNNMRFYGTSDNATCLTKDESFNLNRNSLQYFNILGTAGNAFETNDTPSSAWWHIIRCTHNNEAGYYTDLAIPFNDVCLHYKRVSGGTVQNGGWIQVLDALNYTNYTVKKDGTGASGNNWNIGITGNAATATLSNYALKMQTYKQGSTTETYGTSYPLYAQWESANVLKLKCDNFTVKTDTATKLATARTLTIGNTGKTFDGSGNVSWSLNEIGAAASSHTHSYLPLSGGIVTGDLYLRKGYKVANFNSNAGSLGYINICNITININYANQPVYLKIGQRNNLGGELIIQFDNESNKDPNLLRFWKIGVLNAYLHKASTSTWNLYIQKAEGYDDIQIFELYKGVYMDGVNITFDSTFVSSLPSGCREATLASIPMNIEGTATGLSSTSVLPVANGGTGAITPAGARENLGAYPQADMVFTTNGSEQATSIKFNGKTVYRKVYSIGTIGANSENQIDTGLGTTLDTVFSLRGAARLSDTQYRIPLPYSSKDDQYNYELQIVGAGSTPKIKIVTGTAGITSGFIILEYTKV